MLSCGHDKTVGDILFNSHNEKIAETQAVVCCSEHSQSYDAALANIDQINYIRSVVYNGRHLHLATSPVDPVNGTIVQCYPPRPMASQATIRYTDYNSFPFNAFGCISITTDNGEAFHEHGESGLLVTSLPSAVFPETVDPIGMLFAREQLETMDDGIEFYNSLAIPITKNLQKLQQEAYCGGGRIIF